MSNSFKYLAIYNNIGNKPARSAWARGVKEYAAELISNVMDQYPDFPATREEFGKAMLNGSDTWSHYSWGGCSLIYDTDIAARLCTPSELKKTRNGKRNPNRHEYWLDVQARALHQAAAMIYHATEESELF